MQLHTGGSDSGLQAEINITPLVDVVLVLLIIFMVVVPLLMKGYDVGIPPASSNTAPAPADASQVVLSIAPTTCPMLERPTGDGVPADCRVTLADEEIPATELPTRLAGLLGNRPADARVLFLGADDRLNYEGVLRVVDMATSSVRDLKIEFVETN
jgi:biopolymer transport protein ExbD